MVQLFDFAVMTIFAREFLEGSIIVVEYRAIIRYGGPNALRPGLTPERALREVTLSTLFAAALAMLVVAAIAIPLAVLSLSFDDSASELVEGFSKLVASVSLVLLSLKLPKFLGVGPYGSASAATVAKGRRRLWGRRTSGRQRGSGAPSDEDPAAATGGTDAAVPAGGTAADEEEVAEGLTNSSNNGLTVRAIRFNVAWNLWREVAECGVFLIPFFLTGEGVAAVPLSAASGAAVGIAVAAAISFANRRCKNRSGLAILVAALVAFLSAGLFVDAANIFEERWGETPTVWEASGPFWASDRLPLTLLKPFGYSDTRTVLQLAAFWLWLGGTALLHYVAYRRAKRRSDEAAAAIAAVEVDPKSDGEESPRRRRRPSSSSSDADNEEDADTAEAGESSLEEWGGGLAAKKELASASAFQEAGLSECCSTAAETDETSSSLAPLPTPPSTRGVPGVIDAPHIPVDDEHSHSTLSRVLAMCSGTAAVTPREVVDRDLRDDGNCGEVDEEATV